MDKDICIKCINKNRYYKWNEDDERLWNNGYIFCSVLRVWYYYKDTPKNCPYKLEHLLKENENA